MRAAMVAAAVEVGGGGRGRGRVVGGVVNSLTETLRKRGAGLRNWPAWKSVGMIITAW